MFILICQHFVNSGLKKKFLNSCWLIKGTLLILQVNSFSTVCMSTVINSWLFNLPLNSSQHFLQVNILSTVGIRRSFSTVVDLEEVHFWFCMSTFINSRLFKFTCQQFSTFLPSQHFVNSRHKKKFLNNCWLGKWTVLI